MFKAYLRPVLSETIKYTKKEINVLKRFEGNIIKRMLNISTRCRNTALLLALNIELLNMFINHKVFKITKLISSIVNKPTASLRG